MHRRFDFGDDWTLSIAKRLQHVLALFSKSDVGGIASLPTALRVARSYAQMLTTGIFTWFGMPHATKDFKPFWAWVWGLQTA